MIIKKIGIPDIQYIDRFNKQRDYPVSDVQERRILKETVKKEGKWGTQF